MQIWRSEKDKFILLASAALVASGLLQLAAVWLQFLAQRHGSHGCQCAGGTQRAGLKVVQDGQMRKRRGHEYTWEDDDFPPFLDLDLGAPVALTLEDSRHYALTGSNDDASLDIDAEWESLYPGGSGGFVRLGPTRRFFGLSMYHQMHCLDSLRYAVLGRAHAARAASESAFQFSGKERREVPHAQHCLNYLRQTILCAADLTLEPEVVRGSLDVGEGLGVTHVCRDWSRVHGFVEQNHREYERWSNASASMKTQKSVEGEALST